MAKESMMIMDPDSSNEDNMPKEDPDPSYEDMPKEDPKNSIRPRYPDLKLKSTFTPFSSFFRCICCSVLHTSRLVIFILYTYHGTSIRWQRFYEGVKKFPSEE